ncbi:MAG: bifunctional 5,10-methylenetetrahydrofolate dehydrogenase/5,10-methenyltetrahydrofolate cyclohydrolase [Synergistaceae bacterium]|jgi:methylenetetrahydrofolate dehydrogenase (NADP+)/methenyltetrahydrofolate cyclohydrolase|nr:bifunctional 5,10-methylenetetrahydrofolate dehydrogenase/5,10-methenyltetrahydrofolate cyclohydrolase [Synergistaceae bacterium]
MAVIMKGAEAAARMKESLAKELAVLRQMGIEPGLDIVRVGARPDDLAYEQGALRRFDGLGIAARVFAFPEDISQEDFTAEFRKINDSGSVRGILLFRPLPKHLDGDSIGDMIRPAKDIDCMSPFNAAKVFLEGGKGGFAPCTPAAVMEILAHYGVDLAGKNVVVVGRSPVVGRPLAMLMLARNATVTVCHTKTQNLEEICKNADIVVAAAGRPKTITPACVSPKSIVVDVGINADENGKLCGDADYGAILPIVSMISPVPGGVGAVTTSILAAHVLRAANKLAEA